MVVEFLFADEITCLGKQVMPFPFRSRAQHGYLRIVISRLVGCNAAWMGLHTNYLEIADSAKSAPHLLSIVSC